MPGEANALEPGKRPRSTLQSTLVMKDGQPFMIIGSPGGDDQIMRTMQTLRERDRLRHERAGSDRSAALVVARLPRLAVPAHDAARAICRSESRIPADVQDALKAKGHRLTSSRPWSLGSNAAMLIDWKTGILKAGADPRVDAYAWARVTSAAGEARHSDAGDRRTEVPP